MSVQYSKQVSPTTPTTQCEENPVEGTEDGIDARNKAFNAYATNKTIAQGLLDFALLATNVSQFKHVLHVGPLHHPHYYLLITTISISFFLQVMAGTLLIVLATRSTLRTRTSRLNYVITIIIFLITVINVVISGFNVEVTVPSEPICD